MTTAQLRKEGFRPLTFGYLLPQEEEELERCKAQLSKGAGIKFRCVHTDDNVVEIWSIPATKHT